MAVCCALQRDAPFCGDSGSNRHVRIFAQPQPEADRLAGGAALKAVSHELAFAGVNTRTHGSVGLTKPFPLVIVNFLLTRLADNWLTRLANDAL